MCEEQVDRAKDMQKDVSSASGDELSILTRKSEKLIKRLN